MRRFIFLILLSFWALSAQAQIGTPAEAAPAIDQTFATTHAFTVPVGGIASGSFVVIRGKYNSDSITVTGIADSGSNTYAVDVTRSSGGGNNTGFVASGQIATALTNGQTITVTLSSGAAFYGTATKVTGIATSGALDKTQSKAPSFGTAWTSDATATTAQADELLIGLYTVTGNQSSTPTSPWVEEYDVAPTNPGGRFIAQYQIVAATGAYQAQGTLAAGDSGDTMIATYKGAAAAPPAVRRQVIVIGGK